jgi:protoporphyrinogen oxidase
MRQKSPRVICIGAGPAGLTAAYCLTRAGARVTVLERDPVCVGGISRTVIYRGLRFDVGGHRFFSRSREIEGLWDEILDEEMLTQQRKSRIFYQRKLFDYPLRALDALGKLGLAESGMCVASYLKARLFPIREPRTFEQWITNQFGRRLYSIFFKGYTEKVWGMRCDEISADWAAQRIKGLSLGLAVRKAMIPKWLRRSSATPKTLIEQFRYPRLGPGQMWEAAAAKVSRQGGEVLLGMQVDRLARDAGSGEWIASATTPAGDRNEYRADHVISSAPIGEVAEFIRPSPPSGVLAATRTLRYRDFLTVALVIKDVECFDDHWIYIHETSVKVGRIQNFKSWSPDMVPAPELNCLGMEYFCFRGDGLWRSSDEQLIQLARQEIVELGLVEPGDIIDGTVIRQPKAYPVYADDYRRQVARFSDWLAQSMPGLHLVGRNGMHKYNNQDHSMMTALLTAENILAGEQRWDVWQVNEDAQYHEMGEDRALAFSERVVPGPPS